MASKSSFRDATAAAPQKSGYAKVNGIELYYAVHGSGKPLVLLHGSYGLGESFAPILPQLAAGRQVITVDLQAHGHTADTNRPMTWDAMADDIAALIGHLGLGKTDLMGYSLGGAVALDCAIRRADLIDRLVLVSTPHKHTAWYPDVLAAIARTNNAAAAEWTKQTPMYRTYAAVAPQPENFGRLADKIGIVLGTPYDFSDGVRGLKMPVLLVYGDADSIPPQQAVELFGMLGGGQRDGGWDGSGMVASRFAILPATTHYDIFVSPALVAPVLDFLAAT